MIRDAACVQSGGRVLIHALTERSIFIQQARSDLHAEAHEASERQAKHPHTRQTWGASSNPMGSNPRQYRSGNCTVSSNMDALLSARYTTGGSKRMQQQQPWSHSSPRSPRRTAYMSHLPGDGAGHSLHLTRMLITAFGIVEGLPRR